MTFLKKLRDAARECTKPEYRQLLLDTADRLDQAIADLWGWPTEENMKALNGAWANADRVYCNRPEEGTPAPLSGSPEPARLAA